jgi:methyl-accepting chemotaxis protein
MDIGKMSEIAQANLDTIMGIKNLSEKIDTVWNIISTIDSIAEKTRIIAFNAEIEATSAGESGENFHIVANEIRRLADGIIESTKEIKTRITEIQESSDDLILTSENGTEKIKSGVENAKNLETRFESIKNASEITAESAETITTIIQQQTLASEQILITLKQISAGVSNFSMATEYISQASENLKTVATELSESSDQTEGADSDDSENDEDDEDTQYEKPASTVTSEK